MNGPEVIEKDTVLLLVLEADSGETGLGEH